MIMKMKKNMILKRLPPRMNYTITMTNRRRGPYCQCIGMMRMKNYYCDNIIPKAIIILMSKEDVMHKCVFDILSKRII